MTTHHRRHAQVNNPFANKSRRTVGYTDQRYANLHHRGRSGNLLKRPVFVLSMVMVVYYFLLGGSPASEYDSHALLNSQAKKETAMTTTLLPKLPTTAHKSSEVHDASGNQYLQHQETDKNSMATDAETSTDADSDLASFNQKGGGDWDIDSNSGGAPQTTDGLEDAGADMLAVLKGIGRGSDSNDSKNDDEAQTDNFPDLDSGGAGLAEEKHGKPGIGYDGDGDGDGDGDQDEGTKKPDNSAAEGMDGGLDSQNNDDWKEPAGKVSGSDLDSGATGGAVGDMVSPNMDEATKKPNHDDQDEATKTPEANAEDDDNTGATGDGEGDTVSPKVDEATKTPEAKAGHGEAEDDDNTGATGGGESDTVSPKVDEATKTPEAKAGHGEAEDGDNTGATQGGEDGTVSPKVDEATKKPNPDDQDEATMTPEVKTGHGEAEDDDNTGATGDGEGDTVSPKVDEATKEPNPDDDDNAVKLDKVGKNSTEDDDQYTKNDTDNNKTDDDETKPQILVETYGSSSRNKNETLPFAARNTTNGAEVSNVTDVAIENSTMTSLYSLNGTDSILSLSAGTNNSSIGNTSTLDSGILPTNTTKPSTDSSDKDIPTNSSAVANTTAPSTFAGENLAVLAEDFNATASNASFLANDTVTTEGTTETVDASANTTLKRMNAPVIVIPDSDGNDGHSLSNNTNTSKTVSGSFESSNNVTIGGGSSGSFSNSTVPLEIPTNDIRTVATEGKMATEEKKKGKSRARESDSTSDTSAMTSSTEGGGASEAKETSESTESESKGETTGQTNLSGKTTSSSKKKKKSKSGTMKNDGSESRSANPVTSAVGTGGGDKKKKSKSRKGSKTQSIKAEELGGSIKK